MCGDLLANIFGIEDNFVKEEHFDKCTSMVARKLDNIIQKLLNSRTNHEKRIYEDNTERSKHSVVFKNNHMADINLVLSISN